MLSPQKGHIRTGQSVAHESGCDIALQSNGPADVATTIGGSHQMAKKTKSSKVVKKEAKVARIQLPSA